MCLPPEQVYEQTCVPVYPSLWLHLVSQIVELLDLVAVSASEPYSLVAATKRGRVRHPRTREERRLRGEGVVVGRSGRGQEG